VQDGDGYLGVSSKHWRRGALCALLLALLLLLWPTQGWDPFTGALFPAQGQQPPSGALVMVDDGPDGVFRRRVIGAVLLLAAAVMRFLSVVARQETNRE
jgi:hypothetical protein